MRFLTASLLSLLVLAAASPAAAAPPANDNRADAELLPTFPATAHGTSVEATVERLDPQVSGCGRVESTVWYRIDAAPDGQIVVAVQAGRTFAPVVRIYRRNPSNIQELDCDSAAAGGRVVTSVQAVRGAGYLVLVGKRPGTSDGEFDVRADLFQPPPNDSQRGAQPLGRLPATARATTLGATSDGSDAHACGIVGGSVWYSLRSPASGRVVLKLVAKGELEIAVAVFERVRSRAELRGCAPTGDSGEALVAFSTRPPATYLVLVGERRGSEPGDFTLTARAAEAPERLPGRALPRAGVKSSVNGLTDANDIWSIRFRAGTPYRIAFSSDACASAKLRAPGARRSAKPLLRLGCRAYTTFTPGPDGGGRYTVEVEAAGAPSRQRYRLRVAAAAVDDFGVGRELVAGSAVRGRLSPDGIDVLDLYHFDVPRRSEVNLRLVQSLGRSFSLTVLRDSGRTVATAVDGSTRRALGPGRYVVALRGTVGSRPGAYRLSFRLRDVTTTSVLVSGRQSAEIAPDEAVSLAPVVTPAPAGGLIVLQIDRFDPLTGWHFHRLLHVPVGGAVSWRPPALGRWRVRASFLGTAGSSPSRSGYVHLLVARPIG